MANLMTSLAVRVVRPTWDALGVAECLTQTQVHFYIFSWHDDVDDGVDDGDDDDDDGDDDGDGDDDDGDDDGDGDDDDDSFCLLPANMKQKNAGHRTKTSWN